jgi:hypothetical protein
MNKVHTVYRLLCRDYGDGDRYCDDGTAMFAVTKQGTNLGVLPGQRFKAPKDISLWSENTIVISSPKVICQSEEVTINRVEKKVTKVIRRDKSGNCAELNAGRQEIEKLTLVGD